MNFLKGKDGLSKVLGFLFDFPHLSGSGGGSEAHTVILHRVGRDFDSGKGTH